jgi:hypothetical protein
MAECAAIGIPAWRFWEMTPRETFAHFQGDATRRRLDRAEKLWTAWHNAFFQRFNDANKKLPDLKPMIERIQNPAPSTMSPESVRKAVENYARAMGAEVRYVKRKDLN